MTHKEYKTPNFKIESWQDTIERNKNQLIKLEQESLNLIKGTISNYKDNTPIIFTSGGKDSNLIMYLVRQIINAKGYFNNTSLD